MRTIVLFKVAGHLFGIDREKIVAIAGTNNKKIRTVERDGKQHILLSKGRSSKLYNLAELFYMQPEDCVNAQFCVVEVGGELLTLLVSEKGGLATVRSNALGELPPVFNDEVRAVFPEILLNGNDVILLLSPQALDPRF